MVSASSTSDLVTALYGVESKAEIVGGKIVRMSPTGFQHGRAVMAISFSLHQHSKSTRVGRTFGDNVGFLVDLPTRKSFSPDVAFDVGPSTGSKFVDRPPVFAVEVRSDGDYGSRGEAKLVEKRRDYFAAGTIAVWDVDLESDVVVRLYLGNAETAVATFARGQMAHAEPAVPGWSMPVDELFE